MHSGPFSRQSDWLERDFIEFSLFRHLFSLRFLLFVAVAALFLTIFRQSNERLDGEVYDRDSKDLLPGTTVQLLDFRGRLIDSTSTDATGRFYFAVQQHQAYSLCISKHGYTTRVVADSENMNSSTELILRIGIHRLLPE